MTAAPRCFPAFSSCRVAFLAVCMVKMEGGDRSALAERSDFIGALFVVQPAVFGTYRTFTLIAGRLVDKGYSIK